MKKITLLAVVALAVTFTACKKDRTCTCTWTPVSSTTNGVAATNLGTGGTWVFKMTDVKKGAATSQCATGENTNTSSYTTGGTVYTTVSVNKKKSAIN